MYKQNAPDRSQGREEKMRATSFFARCAASVKVLLVCSISNELLPAALLALLARVLRQGANL